MGLFDGWPFKSRELTEREQREFERRVFPLGLAQRGAALTVLRQVVKAPKLKDPELLYAFIAAKDRYELENRSPEGLDKARTGLRGNRWLAPGDVDAILALVRLDCRAQSLESYPTARDVLAASEEYSDSASTCPND